MCFIRNKSHSFCAVKTVHLQEEKQKTAVTRSTNGYSIQVTQGTNWDMGSKEEWKGKGNWLVVHTC